MKTTKDIFANRFKPAVYDKNNLINFKRPNLWMNGIERTKNPTQGLGFAIFTAFCIASALYFMLR